MKGYTQKKSQLQTMLLLVPAMSPPQQVQRLGRAGPAAGQPHEPLPWATPTWAHKPPPRKGWGSLPAPAAGRALSQDPCFRRPCVRAQGTAPGHGCSSQGAGQADPYGRPHE